MGKDDFMTAKAIGKKLKAKSLQKLQFYCEMCQKQCRDANGFKCHTMSEAHLRKMALFAENASEKLNEFSKNFEKGYMDILMRRYKTKRVNANAVYNEYILDRNHTHMNATIWETLSSFVQYLGQTGKCEIDEDAERGWYIKYIDKDPKEIERQLAIRNGEAAAASSSGLDEDSERKMIIRQIEIAKSMVGIEQVVANEYKPTILQRDAEDVSFAPITIQSSAFKKLEKKKRRRLDEDDEQNGENEDGEKNDSISNQDIQQQEKEKSANSSSNSSSSNISNLQESKSMEQSNDEQDHSRSSKKQRTSEIKINLETKISTREGDYVWAQEGCMVTLKDNSSVKAIVVSVSSKDKIELMTLDENAETIYKSQNELTPSLGELASQVVIIDISSQYFGEIGTLESILFDKNKASVKIIQGKNEGKYIEIDGLENLCEIDKDMLS